MANINDDLICNDSILGFSETDSLNISGGNYSIKISGDDLIVTVGDGKIILQGAAGLSSLNISGSEGDDFLCNYVNRVKILNGDGEDFISDYAEETLNGGSVTILGGSGNDIIRNYGFNVSISGGSGNDKIFGSDGKETLNGGDGKDTLSGGTGNDKLVGGSGNDSLSGGRRQGHD